MNKYKQLAFNTIVFAIGNFGAKIFSLLLNNLYTKHIDPSGFYTKSLIETTALFILPVFTFSLTDAVVRYGLDKKYNKKHIFTTASVLIFFGLMLMIIAMQFIQLIPFLSPIKEYTNMLIIYVCISSVRSLCSQFVRAKGMVRLFAFDGIFTTMTLFIFNVLFISNMKMGVQGFMLSVILSDACSSVFLVISAQLHHYFDIRYFRKKLAKSMLKFSLPLIPTTVMWTFTGFSDQIFIGNICSEEAAGIYSASTKIPNIISMLSTIFFQAWNISAITENDSKGRNEFYEKVYSAYESILFIGSAGLILLIKPISAILINYQTYPEYSKAYLYAPVLIIASVFTCLDQFLSGIYSATKHTINSCITVTIACVANIILNIIFIPVYGIQGATIATFLSYFICFCIRMVDARRYVPFKFSIARTILNTIMILIMCRITVMQLGFIPIIIMTLLVILINIKSLFIIVNMLIKK